MARMSRPSGGRGLLDGLAVLGGVPGPDCCSASFSARGGLAGLALTGWIRGRCRPSSRFTLAFAFGCFLSSVYGFVIGAWPFGVVEIICFVVALRKFQSQRHQPSLN